jgi:S-adenosylmethionine/arginine decarboxylase-like enzyme
MNSDDIWDKLLTAYPEPMVEMAKEALKENMIKKENKWWGSSTHIDLWECDIQILTNADMIKAYVDGLCKLIDMKKYGECQVVHFGEGNKEGYSMFQLIETSNISGHFGNEKRNIHLDIFSYKDYDESLAFAFSKEFFKAEKGSYAVLERNWAE